MVSRISEPSTVHPLLKLDMITSSKIYDNVIMSGSKILAVPEVGNVRFIPGVYVFMSRSSGESPFFVWYLFII